MLLVSLMLDDPVPVVPPVVEPVVEPVDEPVVEPVELEPMLPAPIEVSSLPRTSTRWPTYLRSSSDLPVST